MGTKGEEAAPLRKSGNKHVLNLNHVGFVKEGEMGFVNAMGIQARP